MKILDLAAQQAYIQAFRNSWQEELANLDTKVLADITEYMNEARIVQIDDRVTNEGTIHNQLQARFAYSWGDVQIAQIETDIPSGKVTRSIIDIGVEEMAALTLAWLEWLCSDANPGIIAQKGQKELDPVYVEDEIVRIIRGLGPRAASALQNHMRWCPSPLLEQALNALCHAGALRKDGDVYTCVEKSEQPEGV